MTADGLRVGDVILVRPGDCVVADGDVVESEGAVDEAPVTGESTPRRKAPGDAVSAGTINADTVLRVRVTAAAADNTTARIVRLVVEARERKAPTERLIERFAAVYTPTVVVVAGLVAVVPPLAAGQPWGAWVYKARTVLLIGCPCAVEISTPAAIAAALSAGARRGLLMRGGAVLEAVGRVQDIALDKTGTLTKGRPRVTDLVAVGRSERQVLSLAAAMEAGSSHSLPRAILAHARAAKVSVLPAADASESGGGGVVAQVGGEAVLLGSPAAAAGRVALGQVQRAQVEAFQAEGKTVAVLLAGGQVAGLIAMRDEPRPDTRAGVEAFRRAGVEPVMLTGDGAVAAEAVGRSLGLSVRSGRLPGD